MACGLCDPVVASRCLVVEISGIIPWPTGYGYCPSACGTAICDRLNGKFHLSNYLPPSPDNGNRCVWFGPLPHAACDDCEPLYLWVAIGGLNDCRAEGATAMCAIELRVTREPRFDAPWRAYTFCAWDTGYACDHPDHHLCAALQSPNGAEIADLGCLWPDQRNLWFCQTGAGGGVWDCPWGRGGTEPLGRLKLRMAQCCTGEPQRTCCCDGPIEQEIRSLRWHMEDLPEPYACDNHRRIVTPLEWHSEGRLPRECLGPEYRQCVPWQPASTVRLYPPGRILEVTYHQALYRAAWDGRCPSVAGKTLTYVSGAPPGSGLEQARAVVDSVSPNAEPPSRGGPWCMYCTGCAPDELYVTLSDLPVLQLGNTVLDLRPLEGTWVVSRDDQVPSQHATGVRCCEWDAKIARARTMLGDWAVHYTEERDWDLYLVVQRLGGQGSERCACWMVHLLQLLEDDCAPEPGEPTGTWWARDPTFWNPPYGLLCVRSGTHWPRGGPENCMSVALSGSLRCKAVAQWPGGPSAEGTGQVSISV
ncbi:hypothetical protein JCM17478_35160 [Thermopirellula anaerolimosa]